MERRLKRSANMDELKKIACVEDDESIRMIIQLTLEDVSGFDVTLFSSGQEALSGLEKVAPQLIVLDVMMPGMDGVETFKKLRELPSLSKVPVIFMTAKAQPKEVEEYLTLGASGVIIKPFNPMTLSEKVSEIWRTAA